ncbi:hypothetical protein [Halioglobus maricola]|uniref:hypothetical protein n=1 Tax=Halioglobus maricola TaxID=2601894 RepID=UPI00197AD3CE|nr:hypothetical protein [Halioglobus maricola]
MKSAIAAFGITVAALTTGCASHPDKIDSAYVSPLKYQGYSCSQISQEMGYVGQRTTKLYNRLKSERTADNWQMGVGLVLFWPALFALEGGDGPEAGEYAQLKGDYESLRQNSVAKNCGIESMSPEEIVQGADTVAKKEARQDVRDSGAKHRKDVKALAQGMECQEAVSLLEVTAESEVWQLACGDEETLTVRCFDSECYVKQS